MKIRITALSEDHIGILAELERLCFSDPWSENSLREMLTSETARFFVALADEQVAGYMGTHIVCDSAYVDNIAVFPQYRRHGIAKALFDHVFTMIQANGVEFISLEVRPSNTPALKLYQSLGFENMGIRPNYYRNPTENAFIMTKIFE
ncbi:MAG: ribosomal protein S18-alanine N-acetyltransferase [Acutalibacteraceae bacterium]